MSDSSSVSTISDECQMAGTKRTNIGASLSDCAKYVARICSIISSDLSSRLVDILCPRKAFDPFESCARMAMLSGFGSSMVRVPLTNPVLPSAGTQVLNCAEERVPPIRHVTINSSSCCPFPRFPFSWSSQSDKDSWPQNQGQDVCCENAQPDE